MIVENNATQQGIITNPGNKPKFPKTLKRNPSGGSLLNISKKQNSSVFGKKKSLESIPSTLTPDISQGEISTFMKRCPSAPMINYQFKMHRKFPSQSHVSSGSGVSHDHSASYSNISKIQSRCNIT